MPGTVAGRTGRGRKRWGWAVLMAGAFLAGLLLVGVVLIQAPEAERSTGDKLADSPVVVPMSPAASDNGAPGQAPGPRLAIVVDDFGYDPVRDAEWLDFPERITVSVLPYGPSSKSFAASARTRGFGVILHVPMESEGGVADRTKPFLLRRGMTPEEIADRFARMAADVPQANGACNHMGSAFTSDPDAMASFAQALKRKGFFFVDSVTSAGTVASMAMEDAGLEAADPGAGGSRGQGYGAGGGGSGGGTYNAYADGAGGGGGGGGGFGVGNLAGNGQQGAAGLCTPDNRAGGSTHQLGRYPGHESVPEPRTQRRQRRLCGRVGSAATLALLGRPYSRRRIRWAGLSPYGRQSEETLAGC